MLVFRSGKIAMVWRSDRSSHAELVEPMPDGTIPGPEGPGPYNPLRIQVPPSVKWDDEAFTLWCLEVLGMMMADKPTFSVQSLGEEFGDGSFVAVLKGPIEEMPTPGFLTTVPEAQA